MGVYPKRELSSTDDDTTDDTTRFLTLMFDDKPPDTFLLIWTLPDKRSYWCQTVSEAISTVEKVKADRDVFVGVGLAPHAYKSNHRCKASEIVGIVGLWVDVDYIHPVHQKPNLPPTREDAESVIRNAIPFPPTIIIHSGHGLQAWWQFKEPWIFENKDERKRAEELARRFQRAFRSYAAERNWDVDSTFDLPRVLRVPGAINYKADPVPVEIVELNDSKYNPSDFDFLPPVEDQEPAEIVVGAIIVNKDAVPPFDKFGDLSRLEIRFKQSWDRTRTKKDMQDQSASGYDMSLADYAALAGWSDQEIADLITASRRKHGNELKPVGYYVRTIAKARQNAARLMAAARLGEPESTDATPEERREALLRDLSTTFGMQIDRIVRHSSVPAIFRIETPGGQVAVPIDKLTSQRSFRNAVASVTLHLIPPLSPHDWHTCAQRMLDASEPEEATDEDRQVGQVSSWIKEYLSMKPPMEDPDKAATMTEPYIKDGRVHIFAPDLRKWARMMFGDAITQPMMGTLLGGCGCSPKTEHVKVRGRKTTRYVYVVPPELYEVVEDS